MYKSREIRWFKKEEDQKIVNWFNSRNLSFKDIDSRTDHYLYMPGTKNIGVKLREGNIETKHLTSSPAQGKLTPNTVGFFENYIKWSFNLDSDEINSDKILKGKYRDWIKVKKERLGIKVSRQDGKLMILGISEEVDSGCQVEYTRITVSNEIWYSINLEWFGEKTIHLNEKFLKEILGNIKLEIKDSMGYAEFLNCRLSF